MRLSTCTLRFDLQESADDGVVVHVQAVDPDLTAGHPVLDGVVDSDRVLTGVYGHTDTDTRTRRHEEIHTHTNMHTRTRAHTQHGTSIITTQCIAYTTQINVCSTVQRQIKVIHDTSAHSPTDMCSRQGNRHRSRAPGRTRCRWRHPTR